MAAHVGWRLKISSNFIQKRLSFSLINLSHVRNSHKTARRNVLKVLTTEEEQQKLDKLKGKAKLTISSINNNNILTAPVRNALPILPSVSAVSKPDYPNNENCAFSQNVRFEHIRDSSDSRLGPVITRTKSKKQREKHHEILLEGTKLIQDALEAGAVLKTLYFSRLDAVDGLPLSQMDIPIYKVPHHFMKHLSDMITPPGVMGIFKMPNQGEITLERNDVIPLTLVCDSIQDPGNLGSIIRVAAAAGCERVLLTKGCVDIWETKVLRSGAGSHFRIPLLSSLEWDTVIGYFSPATKIYLADVGHVTSDPSNHFKHPVGEEASRGAKRLSQKENPPSKSEKEDNDGMPGKLSDFSDIVLKRDSHKQSQKVLKPFSLSSQIYHEVNYTGSSLVLIIGNEATGPSVKAKQAVSDNDGICVLIPMAANVESLNNSVASAIIMFEIRRQFLREQKHNYHI